MQQNQPYETNVSNTQYQPQPRKKSTLGGVLGVTALILIICGICGFVGLLFVAALGSDTTSTDYGSGNNLTYTYVSGSENSSNKIVVLYIDQPILTASQDYGDDLVTALLVGQYVFGYQVKEQLSALSNDDSVKGIILAINSPGGTIAGARAISDGVEAYRTKTGKPVYAYVQDMAASGAYWAAVSTDKIIAEQGSLTGSIGVIMGPFEYYDKLVQLGGVGTVNGISITYITAGKSKDLGNPTRKITEEELQVLQEGINSEYDVFVKYVANQRNISEKVIREEVGAMVFGAKEAKEKKLIDEIGTWDSTVEAVATLSGVQKDFKVVKIGAQMSVFGSLFSKLTGDTPPKVTTEIAPARACVLCHKMLYFHGSPLDY